ncbi:hypothetical protein BH11BAC7_BH11BAC7_35060 [soil metagenome]
MGLLFCLAKNVQQAEVSDECADLEESVMEFLPLHHEIHLINMDYFDQFDKYGDTVLQTVDVIGLKKVSEKMIEALSGEGIDANLNSINDENVFTIEEILNEFSNLKAICDKALESQDKTIVLLGD